MTIFLDLGFLAILACAAAGLGLRALTLAGVRPDAVADRLAMATTLGLGGLGLGTFLLGAAGWLTPAGIAALLAAGLIAAIGSIADWRALASAVRDRLAGHDRLEMAFTLLIGGGLIGTLFTALAPVTDGDSLAYHLHLPKVFLAIGGLRFDPAQHESVYPLLTELLYAIGLAIRGPVACRLIHWLLGVSLFGNVTALSRPILGDRARWAGAVALLVPAISNGMTAALNDVSLATFTAGTLLAWAAWLDAPSRRRAILAGAMAGLSLGVKYPALVGFGLLAIAMMVAAIRRRRFGDAILFLSAAVLVGGGWYVRAYLYTGNPVYPFFREAFGGRGFVEVLGEGRRPLGRNPLKLLTALVPMTLDPSRFESRWHQFGPAFLLFLPLLPLTRAPRRAWWIVGFGYLFLTLCLTMRQSPRFALAALGPMAVGVAWVADWASRRGWLGKSMVGLLLLVLAGESAWAVYRTRHGLGVLAGRESAEAFLHRREPTYRVARWVDAHLPANARLIGQDQRGFYFDRPYTIERRHRLATGVAAHGEPAEEVIRAYRDEGFTHLLMCPPMPEDAASFDPALSRVLAPWLEGRMPVFREDITDPEGIVRRYALYDLNEDRRLAAITGEAP